MVVLIHGNSADGRISGAFWLRMRGRLLTPENLQDVRKMEHKQL